MKRFALLPAPMSCGGIDMSSSDFRETVLGEAVHKASEDLTNDILEAHDRIPVQERKVKGLVAYAQDGMVILNVGTHHGVSEGIELSVERVQHTVKDPATGKVIREITDQVGTIRVTSADAESAEATVVSGSGFQVGDIVKN